VIRLALWIHRKSDMIYCEDKSLKVAFLLWINEFSRVARCTNTGQQFQLSELQLIKRRPSLPRRFEAFRCNRNYPGKWNCQERKRATCMRMPAYSSSWRRLFSVYFPKIICCIKRSHLHLNSAVLLFRLHIYFNLTSAKYISNKELTDKQNWSYLLRFL